MLAPGSRVAVVGGGAAGLTAAYLLRDRYAITLFERAPHLGGHATTFVVPDGPDAGTPLDVGFMVLNDRNYPAMHALLADLGVDVAPSEMSFGYHSRAAGVAYALNWSPDAAAAAPKRGPADPFWPLLAEIVRFMRQATRDVAAGDLGDETLGAYFARRGFSPRLVETYLVPMGAAIWSAAPAKLLEGPAAFVLGFYRHHGMLAIDDPTRWQHVPGGSRRYVAAIREALGAGVRTATPVRAVRRHGAHVTVATDAEALTFDALVLATHADEALALLADATPEERARLAPWTYQRNHAVLHGDAALMPPNAADWASWNFDWEPGGDDHDGPKVTYHLNRLQGLHGTTHPYFLSLNPRTPPAKPLATFDFDHPVYSPAAVATQPALAAANGANRTWLAGSYFGFGFHEDAIRSGAAVAEALGVAR